MAGYLEGLGSKQRKEFKRKMRRAAEYPARVTWRLADQANTFSDEIEIFLELMANDAEKREFLSEPMKQHFRTLALEGSPEGWIKLAFLEVSGNPIFGYLNFIAQNRIWVYNSGFDPDHFALSPGWVLMGHLIEWAIQNQLEAIDFLRGDEQYKNRLGGIDRFVCRLTIES
jgi:CelD/BcsL family acetyltransferase involved in cellulose biosynthesis